MNKKLSENEKLMLKERIKEMEIEISKFDKKGWDDEEDRKIALMVVERYKRYVRDNEN